jgi:hypothetical protein
LPAAYSLEDSCLLLVDPSYAINCLRSLQIGILLAIPVAFFVLTSQTLFVILGRYDKYLKVRMEYKGTSLEDISCMAANPGVCWLR